MQKSIRSTMKVSGRGTASESPTSARDVRSNDKKSAEKRAYATSQPNDINRLSHEIVRRKTVAKHQVLTMKTAFSAEIMHPVLVQLIEENKCEREKQRRV
jgi:hypothetical protein